MVLSTIHILNFRYITSTFHLNRLKIKIRSILLDKSSLLLLQTRKSSTMNNYFSFQEFEILKKGSQGTILKALDTEGRFFAIKIDKKLSSVPFPSCSAQNPSSSSKSPSPHPCSTQTSPISSPLPPTFTLCKQPHLKGSQMKEMEFLIKLQGIKGIPNFFWGGVDPELERFIIVEELTGHDLEYYFNKFEKFSLTTTLKIALQLLKILKGIHERGVIHRDIKPENLALSLNNKNIILLDFGLARHITHKNKKIKEGKTQMKFVGNLKFCGLNAHSFKNDTKVDDLVSLGILIIYFLQGKLVWDYRHNSNFVRSVEEIGFEKVNFISKQMPILYPLLYPFFKHLCSVKNDRVNYNFLENVLEEWALAEKIDLNSEIWDWTEENSKTDFNRHENNCDQIDTSKENFQDDSCETTVSELMINYRVPNL